MLFGKPTLISPKDRVKLFIGTSELACCLQFDYLGIRLNSRLSFGPHIDMIVRNCDARLCTLSQIQRYIDQKTAILFYKASIMSKLQYGLVFAESALQKERRKIPLVQNRAMRICGLSERRRSNSSLHQECRVLPINLRCKIDLLCLMHNRVRRHLASSSSMQLTTRSQTRLLIGPTLPVPRPFSSVFLRSISYVCPAEWQQLPAQIRSVGDLAQLKKHIRHIVNIEFDGLSSI